MTNETSSNTAPANLESSQGKTELPNVYRPKTTLEQWRILQAVVDYGGYAQAADALNKSQSSLNHAVTKLQQMLGVQILEVKGRKAYLTKAGEVLLRRSRQLSRQINDLEEIADTMNRGWEPELNLVVEMPYPQSLLLGALQVFYPQSRGTRLQIRQEVISGTQEAIVEKRADIVIAESPPQGFASEPLCSIAMVPVCAPNHALTQPNMLTLDELAEHLQIVIRDTGNRPVEQKGWLRAEQRWTVNSFYDAIELLQAGLGFCWLPQHLVQPYVKAGQLTILPIQSGKARRLNMVLVHPNREKLGPCAQLLTQCILDQHQLQRAEAMSTNTLITDGVVSLYTPNPQNSR